MNSQNKGPNSQGPELPFQWVKNVARRSRALRSVLDHMHVLQIIDDHQAMWLEALDAEERRDVERRLQMQLSLAFVNFAGLEITVHGAIEAIMVDPFYGGLLFVAGVAVIYATSGKG